MKKIGKLQLIALILMALLSLASLLGVRFGKSDFNLASLTLVIGIVMYFITWKSKNADDHADLLDIKKVPKALKDKSIILLILMPMFMNAICNVIAKLALPEFIDHLNARTSFLAMDKVPLLIIEFLVAALGEELAWRAFFQKQLTKGIPFVPALIISSALFAICHCSQGEFIVVFYDLLFVFINALFYGLIFKKSNNAIVSALAHFLANLFAAVCMFFM